MFTTPPGVSRAERHWQPKADVLAHWVRTNPRASILYLDYLEAPELASPSSVYPLLVPS